MSVWRNIWSTPAAFQSLSQENRFDSFSSPLESCDSFFFHNVVSSLHGLVERSAWLQRLNEAAVTTATKFSSPTYTCTHVSPELAWLQLSAFCKKMLYFGVMVLKVDNDAQVTVFAKRPHYGLK